MMPQTANRDRADKGPLVVERGEMPPDGGCQMVSDLLAASEKLLDQDTKGSAVRQDADSGPRDEDP